MAGQILPYGVQPMAPGSFATARVVQPQLLSGGLPVMNLFPQHSFDSQEGLGNLA
jgi:hypothetical protein